MGAKQMLVHRINAVDLKPKIRNSITDIGTVLEGVVDTALSNENL